ncbi:glucosinolate gamma-glutamyl hydrolase [Sarracenia purpurea var. burkii]
MYLIFYQILGRALGGKIGRAISGWDIGVRTVELSPSSELFASLKMPKLLSIIECHQDEVWELPPGAEVMAWSKKTGIEMFRYGDHMMGIQGHPECTNDILLHLVDCLLDGNLIMESYAAEVKASMNGQEPDKEAWKKLCISFLKALRRWANSVQHEERVQFCFGPSRGEKSVTQGSNPVDENLTRAPLFPNRDTEKYPSIRAPNWKRQARGAKKDLALAPCDADHKKRKMGDG